MLPCSLADFLLKLMKAKQYDILHSINGLKDWIILFSGRLKLIFLRTPRKGGRIFMLPCSLADLLLTLVKTKQ